MATGAPSNLPSFKGLAAKIAGAYALASEIDHYDARLDQFVGELTRQKVDVHGLCREITGIRKHLTAHRGKVSAYFQHGVILRRVSVLRCSQRQPQRDFSKPDFDSAFPELLYCFDRPWANNISI